MKTLSTCLTEFARVLIEVTGRCSFLEVDSSLSPRKESEEKEIAEIRIVTQTETPKNHSKELSFNFDSDVYKT